MFSQSKTSLIFWFDGWLMKITSKSYQVKYTRIKSWNNGCMERFYHFYHSESMVKINLIIKPPPQQKIKSKLRKHSNSLGTLRNQSSSQWVLLQYNKTYTASKFIITVFHNKRVAYFCNFWMTGHTNTRPPGINVDPVWQHPGKKKYIA